MIVLGTLLVLIILIGMYISFILLLERGALINIHLLKRAKKNHIRVACVGDSITYGGGHLSKRNYPAQLNKLLGKKYCVNNYGFACRTCQNKGDFPYTKDSLYKKSLRFNPDIVILMLGTNDSKLHNWEGVDSFMKDYKELIDSYKRLDSYPKIYLLTPPPIFAPVNLSTGFDIDGEVIANIIRPAIIKLAKEEELTLIDMYLAFEDKEKFFPDKIHPNYDGAAFFAKKVYESLTNRN